ncbi:(13S,14R)-1,13-dihydroxy-N-methylcanadine 13-O-acetyltransferase AT1-like [Tripterygium wilfordii]|uniref:(13S,14R)-1,13-dihydroxy-N-methylcanadine 13-O-acetyltransferase AT1-like n=1 Tax=Tripterygium wilfordii TaxID=458696 RepID=UPI0018F83855|nr:(13S,14R)-1,13-dihydroxy-N-methylcanadine 13-O-acetyltransferase AT1-like [Tripterygium wilfordii]
MSDCLTPPKLELLNTFLPFRPVCTVPLEMAVQNNSSPNEAGKLITKRFLFSAASISTLKAKARSAQIPNPTRAEVVSGLLWKCAMNTSKPSILSNAVNIRPRLEAPLPDYSIGNIFLNAIANYDPIRSNHDLLPLLVSLLRKSVDGINSKNLQKFQGEEGFEEIRKLHEKHREMFSCCSSCKPVVYMVTAVSRMGFYEVDFGWRKPIWVAWASINETFSENLILQLGNRTGDGIDQRG